MTGYDEQMDDNANIITKTVKLKFVITEIEDRSIQKVKLIVEPTEDAEPDKNLRKLKDEEDKKEGE